MLFILSLVPPESLNFCFAFIVKRKTFLLTDRKQLLVGLTRIAVRDRAGRQETHVGFPKKKTGSLPEHKEDIYITEDPTTYDTQYELTIIL